MKPTPTGLKALSWITAALLIGAIYLVLFYAPREATMGDVQRIFYFHIAAGWTGALGFLVTAVAGGLFLATNDRKWDRTALASVEIGIVFIFINIVTGSIWARPIWNTWWTWDPRLTTATIMELAYTAYLMLRQGLEDPDRQARFGAVYGIVAFISVPLTFLSIHIFRTIHPVIIGGSDPGAQGVFQMAPAMRAAFFFSLFTFTFIYITLLWHRCRLQQLREEVERKRLEAFSA